MQVFKGSIIKSLCAAMVVGNVFFMGCVEEKRPSVLKISPERTIKMKRSNAKEELDAMAYDEKTRPFIGVLDVKWSSSDKSVISVDANGVVTPVGSGEAFVIAEAMGLKAQTKAMVTLVGSLEIAKDTPKRLKIFKKDHQLKVIVKDDKGNVIEKPKVGYVANNYCVDVSADGLVHPQAVGKCSVTATSMGKSDTFEFDVR